MQQGIKPSGGPLDGSNTTGVGERSKRIRQREREKRKVQYKLEKLLPHFRLNFCTRSYETESNNQKWAEREMSLTKDLQSMPEGCCGTCFCSKSEEQSHNQHRHGLQGPELRSPLP